MSSNSDLTKECIYCAHAIPNKAKRCEACGAFQGWRRFFGGPPNVLMIVTLVGILTSLGLNWLQIRELATKAAATRDEVKATRDEVVESAKQTADEIAAVQSNVTSQLSTFRTDTASQIAGIKDKFDTQIALALERPEFTKALTLAIANSREPITVVVDVPEPRPAEEPAKEPPADLP